MRYISIFTLWFMFMINASHAQKPNPCVIENVPESVAWEVVYQSFKQHNKKLGGYNKQTQTAVSGYYKYTSMLIENRARYQVTYIDGTIEIKFIDRQYLSTDGWANTLLPLSKRTKKKYIYPITETIREILTEKNIYVEELAGDNKKNNNSRKQEEKEPGGVYENFAIVKTGDPKMQLLAIHNDSSMIGFRLTSDYKRVIAITFKRNEQAPAFVLTFDDEGKPKGGGFGDDLYVFMQIDSNLYNMITVDADGNRIRATEIELPSALEIYNNIVPDGSGHGPNPGDFVLLSMTDADMDYWIELSTRVLNVVGCTVAVATTGFAAALPCGALFLDEILRVLPKDHVYYDELVLASKLLSVVSAKSFMSDLPKSFMEGLPVVLGSIIATTDGVMEFLDKNFSTVILNESKPYLASKEKEYKRIDGVSTVHIEFSKFLTKKEREIAIYKIDTNGSATLYEVFQVKSNMGEKAFDVPFNGQYEVRALYDGETMNSIVFTVTGDDAVSNSKYKDMSCLYIAFGAGIPAKWYLPNKQSEPENVSFLPFGLDYWTCVDSKAKEKGYHVEPLQISWSGNKFMATATRYLSFDMVTYQIEGEVSADGKTLKSVRIKETSTRNKKDYHMSNDKEVNEIWLRNIPLDPKDNVFRCYKNKFGSHPNESVASDAIVYINYIKTVNYPENPENNFVSKYVKHGDYKTDQEGSFSFELRFYSTDYPD